MGTGNAATGVVAGASDVGPTHFPISLTATLMPRRDALYTFPKLPLPILVHSRLDESSDGSKSGPTVSMFMSPEVLTAHQAFARGTPRR